MTRMLLIDLPILLVTSVLGRAEICGDGPLLEILTHWLPLAPIPRSTFRDKYYCPACTVM